MNKLIISLTLILFSLILNAQESDSVENSVEREESYITFDVFSSLNKYSPRWRVGYVKGIHPNWKIGLNLGYGNRNISYTQFIDEIFEEDYELWELRPELYYVIKQSQKSTFYSSFELYYINHKDVFHNKSIRLVSSGAINYDQADYLRQKYGFNFNIGTFRNLGRKLGLNFYVGGGLKIRNNSFSDIINPSPLPDDYYDFIDMYDTFEYASQEGIECEFNFSIGFKLYIKIRN